MPARTNFENARFPATDFGDYRTVEEKARLYKEQYQKDVASGKRVPLPDHTWEEYEEMHAARGEPTIKPDFLPSESLGAPTLEKDRKITPPKNKKKLKPGSYKDKQSKKVSSNVRRFGSILFDSELQDRLDEERRKADLEAREAKRRNKRRIAKDKNNA